MLVSSSSSLAETSLAGHTVVRCKAAPKDDGDEAGAGPTGWENAGDTTGWNTAETTDTAIGW